MEGKSKNLAAKYYFNKISGEELLDLLSFAVEKSIEMVAWLKGREKDIQIFYPIKLDKNQGKLFLDYSPEPFKPKKSEFINRNIFLKMNMEKYYLFGYGNLKFENDSYILNTSSEFYKSQQRENIRVQSVPNLNLKMQLKIGEEIFNLNDISASGASFFSPKEKASDFNIGKTLSKVIVYLEEDSFKISQIEIVKELENSPENFNCFAIKFLNFPFSEETKLVVKLNALKRKKDLLLAKKTKIA